MSKGVKPVEIESIALRDVADALRESKVFANTNIDELSGVPEVERLTAESGTTVVDPKETQLYYWLVLSGGIRAQRPEPDGTLSEVGVALPGEGFGEVPLLMGKKQSSFFVRAVEDSVLLRFSEDAFWAMMACCPAVRKVVLTNMSQRMQSHQVEALHREKLV